ncbi:MAG: NYN domain-containing protein, partial [Alsobacter sp.]
AMQRRGVRVSVVSTIASPAPMVADELRWQADEFIDIVTLIPRVGRDPSERAERPARTFERRPSAPGDGTDDGV